MKRAAAGATIGGDQRDAADDSLATLRVAPSLFGLRSIEPRCIVAEAALRFARVQFEVKTESVAAWFGGGQQHPQLDLVVDRKPVSWNGLDAVMQSVNGISSARYVKLNAGLSNAQLGWSDAVAELVRGTIFPACDFFVFGVEGSQSQAATLWAQEASFVQRALSPSWKTRCAARLRDLRAAHNIHDLDSAVAAMTRGLAALEGILHDSGLNVESSSPVDFRFALGTLEPTRVDCFVFAAATIAFASHLAAAARRERCYNGDANAFPLLRHYQRHISLVYFEHYAGLHYLELPPAPVLQKEPDPYAPGRVATIVGTSVFALVYFLVVNVPMFISAVEVEAADAAAVPQAGGQATAAGPASPAPAPPVDTATSPPNQ